MYCSTIALKLCFTSFYDVSEILNTLGSHKTAIWCSLLTVRMSWTFLQGEMTSFVIFFSSCLVFIISLSLFNIIWGRKTFSKSPSSSWEVIWGNQRRPLSLFHIPFAKADQDHHDVRSQCTVLFGTRIISTYVHRKILSEIWSKEL